MMLLGLCACGGAHRQHRRHRRHCRPRQHRPRHAVLCAPESALRKLRPLSELRHRNHRRRFFIRRIGRATCSKKNRQPQRNRQATKASAENINLLNDGSIDLATCSFPTTLQGFLGDGSWSGKPQDLQVLFNMYGNPIHVIVMSDSPYKTMEDLKGKTISVGQAGSGNYNSTMALLEGIYGWKEGVDYKAEYLSYSESEDAFKNGQIDAAVFDTVAPHATIIDLASWKPIRLLSIDSDLLAKTENNYAQQFYTITIPANTYNGQTDDVVCAAHGNYVCTTSKMSEDLAYEVISTIFSNLDYMGTVHEALKKLTVQSGCETGGLEMHAGAIKYFTEQGIDVMNTIKVADR
jgi:TRAP transporter TAXI family solute receptor